MEGDTVTKLSLREIDALAAEKVLGWTPHPTLSHEWWRLPETKEKNIRLLGCEDGPWDRVTPPRCTTDLAAAWLLVQAMQAKDCWTGFTLHDGPGIIVDGEHFPSSARFFNAGYPAFDVMAGGVTAPLAITLAALASVGVNVEADV